MAPGTQWVYAETDPQGGRQRVEVTVLQRTKMIRGIEARVVHDVVTEQGEPVEKTFDWYAQDSGGTIWYLGENTKEYEDGEVVSTAGSFEYGVDGAQAGVAVPANPVAGCGYRQEYYEGEAEDRGRVLSTRDDIKVRGAAVPQRAHDERPRPAGAVRARAQVLRRGCGPVQAVEVSPGASREVLLHVTTPGS